MAIIKSYLTDRTATLTLEGERSSKTLRKGCPQGSQLGPAIWNIAMNAALKKPTIKEIKTTAYADDLVVLAGAQEYRLRWIDCQADYRHKRTGQNTVALRSRQPNLRLYAWKAVRSLILKSASVWMLVTAI